MVHRIFRNKILPTLWTPAFAQRDRKQAEALLLQLRLYRLRGPKAGRRSPGDYGRQAGDGEAGHRAGDGRWAFPSGYVDRGEAVADAAVREVMEETGLDVRLTAFVGLYSSSGSVVVLAVYSAEVVGGSLRPGGDARETALFDPEALPPLPFPHDDQIIADWRSVTGKKNSPR